MSTDRATTAQGAPADISRRGKLLAGAAKVEITPTADELPAQYLGINDPIFTRAIVLDNGFTRAALVTLDAGSVSTDTWRRVSRAIDSQLGIPADCLILTATHTHSVPRSLENTFADHIVEAVRQASEASTPARMAYGTGLSHINVNRNRFDSVNSQWWEGPNYDGVSDKTVAVLSFTTDTISRSPSSTTTGYMPWSAGCSTRSALTSQVLHPTTSSSLSETPSWRCGPKEQQETRTRSTTSRRTICARCESLSTPNEAWTSATRCPPAARALTATTPRSPS